MNIVLEKPFLKFSINQGFKYDRSPLNTFFRILIQFIHNKNNDYDFQMGFKLPIQFIFFFNYFIHVLYSLMYLMHLLYILYTQYFSTVYSYLCTYNLQKVITKLNGMEWKKLLF